MLTDIQKLQFSNKQKAESDLLAFLKQNEDEAIDQVELAPRPQSLNSINGFVTYRNGDRFFFKTHTEENEQLSEYYNADLLANVGYPIYQARQVTHRPGKQIVLYEIISLPTLFDLLKTEEDAFLLSGQHSTTTASLLRAQEKLERSVFEIYENTLTSIDTARHEQAPVHQLFSHRLADDGRLSLFYRGKSLELGNRQLSFEELASKRWVINGVEYDETLNEIIERAQKLLRPKAGAAIVGHGDAHNGNIFVDLEKEVFSMFDPAFAGLHNPLLDLTKPTFHNVFARWMYYPEQVKNEFDLTYKIDAERIIIEHSFFPSKLRLAFLATRQAHIMRPTFRLLHERQLLPENWQQYIRAALFCCPFLTVNLFAKRNSSGSLAEQYVLPVRFLGLALAVEFGASERRGSNSLTEVINDLVAFDDAVSGGV